MRLERDGPFGRGGSADPRQTEELRLDEPARPSSRGPRSGGGYPELRRRVRDAGLLERSIGYYAVLCLALIAGLAATFGLVSLAPGLGDALAVPVFSLLLVQIGLVGHDAGHNGIFRDTRYNRLVGLIAFPMFLGVSFENWTRKHNTHHAHTNEVGVDPDITGQVLVFTPEQAASRRGLLGWVARHQGSLYFLMALGATVGFRIDAWRYAIASSRAQSAARWELALICANFVGWFVVPGVVFGPVRWLVLFGVAQLVIGVYMASVFAPNHKGMPLVIGERPDFLAQQVLTSRNVSGGPIVDFLYGGLNYQIEHHLFPNMPRNKLPECRKIVRAFCAELGLPHEEHGVIASYRLLLSALDSAGRGEPPRVLAG